MMISIHDVPADERRFLFSTDPRLTRPELDKLVPMDELGAVNRSLAALGEEVEQLFIAHTPGRAQQDVA